MTELETRLQKDLMEAMKSHNEIKLGAVRSVKTAIQNEKVNGTYHELTDNDIVKLIQKQIKQRDEATEMYKTANRNELAEKELAEKNYLNEYVPQMLSNDKLTDAISVIMAELGASTMKDMGKVMKELSARYPNQYDGKSASTIIRSKLV